jgi:hypothetical protein
MGTEFNVIPEEVKLSVRVSNFSKSRLDVVTAAFIRKHMVIIVVPVTWIGAMRATDVF